MSKFSPGRTRRAGNACFATSAPAGLMMARTPRASTGSVPLLTNCCEMERLVVGVGGRTGSGVAVAVALPESANVISIPAEAVAFMWALFILVVPWKRAMMARDAGFGGRVTVIVTLARSPGATVTDLRENTAIAAMLPASSPALT